MVFPRIAFRLLKEMDKVCLGKLAWNMGYKGMKAMRAFEKRGRRSEVFPPFLFISLTDACNLRCQGCWTRPSLGSRSLTGEDVDLVIRTARMKGSHFFGLLGGEPLLWDGLFDLMARWPDCYFQVFTNGTLLDAERAEKMRVLGNVTPLISVEGVEDTSDIRRGGEKVHERAMAAIECARNAGLFIGVASSICQSNIEDLASGRFVEEMIRKGVHYLWYYIYRPVGPEPSPELALSGEQIVHLRRFMVEERLLSPILIIDAYWDHLGRAICPAAAGISHHVGPAGDIEPCPPIQFSKENIRGDARVDRLIQNSLFLRDFRDFAARTTMGCVLLEAPQDLEKFVSSQEAKDTTGRGTGLQEIQAMTARDGHHQPGREIPERSFFYRWAKKKWFCGLGAYG